MGQGWMWAADGCGPGYGRGLGTGVGWGRAWAAEGCGLGTDVGRTQTCSPPPTLLLDNFESIIFYDSLLEWVLGFTKCPNGTSTAHPRLMPPGTALPNHISAEPPRSGFTLAIGGPCASGSVCMRSTSPRPMAWTSSASTTSFWTPQTTSRPDTSSTTRVFCGCVQ